MSENLYLRFACAKPKAVPCIEVPHGRTWTQVELDRYSARAANALTTLGCEPGDRVSVICEKSPYLVGLYLGCLRGGYVYHPLNTAYTVGELSFFLANAATRMVVVDPAYRHVVGEACRDLDNPPEIETLSADGTGSLAERLESEPGHQNVIERETDDPAALLYSSGTTGTPKGIPLSHGNLFSNANALVTAWAFSDTDILLHALPLYHVHGLFITLNPTLMSGTRIRLLSKFDAAQVVEQLPGATMMAGVPTYYSRLLLEPGFGGKEISSVRVFISGSAPLSEATFLSFLDRTGHRILERYGMTETGINTSNPLDGERKVGSVGPQLPGTELRVVDDSGAICAPGAIGHIEVRGNGVFNGYWELPEKTAEAFDDEGWFATGDQGQLDEDGYLFIVGRSKDMVITGGLNVYPKEIERLLDVRTEIAESAVFGVPHADFGEAVVAAVVVAPGQSLDEANVRTELKQQLAGYKVPKRITVVDELPRNTMGKVQKSRLRETYATLAENNPA